MIFLRTMIYHDLVNTLGFPGGSVVKNLHANAGDMGSIHGKIQLAPTCLFTTTTESVL